jgi:hypothetical protein
MTLVIAKRITIAKAVLLLAFRIDEQVEVGVGREWTYGTKGKESG